MEDIEPVPDHNVYTFNVRNQIYTEEIRVNQVFPNGPYLYFKKAKLGDFSHFEGKYVWFDWTEDVTRNKKFIIHLGLFDTNLEIKLQNNPDGTYSFTAEKGYEISGPKFFERISDNNFTPIYALPFDKLKEDDKKIALPGNMEYGDIVGYYTNPLSAETKETCYVVRYADDTTTLNLRLN